MATGVDREVARFSIRVLLRALSVVATLAQAATAQVDEAAISIADDEIVFDAENRAFSRKLPSGHEFKIAVVESGDTRPILRYGQGKKCDKLDGVKKEWDARAGAPQGAVVDGKRKFVFHVGPLDFSTRYCFELRVARYIKVSAGESETIALAVEELLVDLHRRCLRGPCPELTPNLFANSLRSLLPSRLREARTAGGQELPTAVAAELFQDPAGRTVIAEEREVRGGLSRRIRAAHDTRHRLRKAVGRLVSGSAVAAFVYDPLQGIGAAEWLKQQRSPGTPRLRADDLNRIAAAIEKSDVIAERSPFLDTLWQYRGVLRASRRPLDDAAREALVGGYLDLETKPTPILWMPGELGRRVELTADGDPTAAARAAEELATALEAATLTRAWVEQFAGLAENLEGMRRDGRRLLDDLVAVRDKTAQLTSTWGKLAKFVEGRIEKHEVLTAAVAARAPAGFEDRLPFYLSVDVGAALVVLRRDDLDALQYVGFNFYFRPVDKDVPLEPPLWRDPGRRLSITGGIATIGPRASDVSGVLGSHTLLLGGGYRLTDYVRLGVGAVVFRQEDPSPVRADTELRAALYTALSVDLDVFGTMADAYARATGKP